MTPAHCGSDGRPAAPGLRVLGAQWARAVPGQCPGARGGVCGGATRGRPELSKAGGVGEWRWGEKGTNVGGKTLLSFNQMQM